MVPALAPAYLTAALFSFLASMDNYPVSIFLTDARSKTLPIKMLQYIEESPDPSIAALSSLILIATLALLFIAGGIAGGWIGALLAKRLSVRRQTLTRVLGCMLVVVAAYMLYRSLT